MCSPALLLVGTLVGTGAAAYSQYETGQANKKLANQNAKIASEQAADSQRRGAIAEDEKRAEIRARLGAQRATLGANNVVSTTGTPLGLLAETAQYGELDALTVRNNAARESYGFKVEGFNSRARGRIAAKEGTLGAAATLLGGGSQAFGNYKTQTAKPAGKAGG